MNRSGRNGGEKIDVEIGKLCLRRMQQTVEEVRSGILYKEGTLEDCS